MSLPRTCSHGVPFFGDPRPTCDHCELIWEESCLRDDLKGVEKHTKRIEFLKMRIVSQECGDA